MSETTPGAGTAPNASDGTAPITAEDVVKVAKLARLRLSEEDLERFTGQLADILGHAADIEALDLTDVEPMARPIPLANVLRADEPGEPLDREEVLACAPMVEDNQFRVPPSFGEDA